MTSKSTKPYDDPLKVLIVSQYFWPEDFRINELAKGLADRGHSVTVLTGQPNYPDGKIYPSYGYRGPYTEMHNGVSVIRAPLIPRGTGSKALLILNYFSFAISASIVAFFRIGKEYDAVFVYQISPVTAAFPAFVAARRANAPVFTWVLDLWPDSLSASGMVSSSFALRTARWLAQKVYMRSDILLASSAGFSDPIREISKTDREVRWFPQWENADPTSSSSNGGKDIPVLPNGFKVLFAGNVGASQDFETILSSAELLKGRTNIQWLIVGDGRKLSWVRNEIKRRRLEQTVHCLGRFPSHFMTAFYARSDALLISLRDEPAFALTVPAKLQSYLAAGKPIVSAVNGEVMRIVEGVRAGYSAPAGDPAKLAEAVEKLSLVSIEERAAMGERGRTHFEANFDREQLFDRFVDWFRQERNNRTA